MSSTARSTALLLDGRRDDEPTLALVHGAVVEALAADGWDVDDWHLRDETIAWCVGCFGCWVKTPGVCVQPDAGRRVAERMACSDLLVYLTPVTFGGYSAELKKALDHLIPVLLPDLKKTGDDTRHPLRYERARDLLVVGTVPAGEKDGAEAHTFRRLVARNALNVRPRRWAAGVVEDGAAEPEVRVAVGGLLSRIGVGPAHPSLSVSMEVPA